MFFLRVKGKLRVQALAVVAAGVSLCVLITLISEKPISPLALLAKKLVQTMRTLKHKDKKYKRCAAHALLGTTLLRKNEMDLAGRKWLPRSKRKAKR